MTPHKHAAVIKAWADGATIQYRTENHCPWLTTDSPNWFTDREYRVKPTTVTFKCVRSPSGKVYSVSQNEWYIYEKCADWKFVSDSFEVELKD